MSSAAQRALRVLKALRGHTITGISNTELAEKLGETQPNVTRALQDLIEEGLAEKDDQGRFKLSICFLQIAGAFLEECDRANSRIHELKQRVFAGGRQ